MSNRNRRYSDEYKEVRKRLKSLLVIGFGTLDNFIEKTQLPRSTCHGLWTGETKNTGMYNLWVIKNCCPWMSVEYLFSVVYVSELRHEKG